MILKSDEKNKILKKDVVEAIGDAAVNNLILRSFLQN